MTGGLDRGDPLLLLSGIDAHKPDVTLVQANLSYQIGD